MTALAASQFSWPFGLGLSDLAGALLTVLYAISSGKSLLSSLLCTLRDTGCLCPLVEVSEFSNL